MCVCVCIYIQIYLCGWLLFYLNGLQEIFQLNVMALGKLSCESGRCYSKAIQILENTARVKSVLLMLDLEFGPLVVDLFQQFLNTIR